MTRALQAVERAAARRETAEAEFRAKVVAARDAGETLRAIAAAAGLTNPAVLYIVRKETAKGDTK